MGCLRVFLVKHSEAGELREAFPFPEDQGTKAVDLAPINCCRP